MNGILGRKHVMSQIWKDNKVVPVTVIKAEPNTVALVRTKDRDGYEAVQLVVGKKKREFRATETPSETHGSTVTVEQFKEGDKVSITGITKGRGFQGVVKRHGFAGGPKTHGQKNRFRAPGSIGNTAAQRVVPGRRMAGHMGDVRVTVKNIVVVKIDPAAHTLMVKGGVPGARGSLLLIRKVIKKTSA